MINILTHNDFRIMYLKASEISALYNQKYGINLFREERKIEIVIVSKRTYMSEGVYNSMIPCLYCRGKKWLSN